LICNRTTVRSLIDELLQRLLSGIVAPLPRFVRGLQTIAREHGPFDVWIGHSMGANAALAARIPQATLLLTRGLGHRRVIGDPEAGRQVAGFLAAA